MLRRGPGFTLVELLVAMALSLIVILAVTQVFRLVGDNVLAGRAVLEMSGQLRSAADQLQRDLGGLTVPVRPWPETSSGAGYFEYYEGPFWDLGLGPGAAGIPPAPRVRPWYSESSVGDIDDVLMFTTCTTGTPFVGQIMASIDPTSDPSNVRLFIDPSNPLRRQTIESRVAEVAWFTRFNDRNGNGQPDPGELTLHRRVFLVLPNLDLSDPTIQALSPLQFYSAFDLSVRTLYDPSVPNIWGRAANSLEDLTRRENRIAHDVSGAYPSLVTPNRPFPSLFWRALLVPQGSVATLGVDGQWGVRGVDDDGNGTPDDISEAGHFGSDDLTRPIDVALPPMPPPPFASFPGPEAFAESYGSDVVLTNLLAFDVQAYDPAVAVYQAVSGSDPVLPSDPGYGVGPPVTVLGRGGYVDLFYQRYTGVPLGSSLFSDPPLVRSGMQANLPIFWGEPYFPAVYDTWSQAYEHDGLDQDGDGITDEGTNGIDDDNANGVDDVGERETSPPYPVPLRGIQVRLRIIDRDSRQVRQMTVSSDFIPE
jgi:prepilin-type N-terminal cleavage/methylation domain-containing protein